MISTLKKQPLYDQLVDLLRDKIQSELKPGDVLPSERELSEKYGLSRTTVRLALRKLEDLGLIYKKHGKGSIVADSEASAADLSMTYSFSEHMKMLGRIPKSTTLTFTTIESNKYLARHMEVELGTEVYCIKRLRMADFTPLMVETTYLPVDKFPMLSRLAIEQGSLYSIFENSYGQYIKLAEEEFSASIVGYDDAKLLQVTEGSPALYILRSSFNEKNELIEFTQSIARADQFKYTVAHIRN